MAGRPGFDGYSGPAALIDRMIGEEYAVIKAVAEKIPELQEILDAIKSIEDFNVLIAALTAARDAAAASAQGAAGSAAEALAFRNATDAFRAQAQGFAAAALASEGSATASKTAAASSANSANNSAISAGASQGSAAASATLAQNWATKPTTEVVAGQGFSAKKYAGDAGNSATQAQAAAASALAAKAASELIKAEVTEIAGFDPTLYATKLYVKKATKRAAIIFGS